MKQVSKIILLGVMILLALGCERKGYPIDGDEKRYLHNMTGQDITIVCTVDSGYAGPYTAPPRYDSVVVMSEEYFLLEKFVIYEGVDEPQIILNNGRVVVYMDNQGFLMDRNDANGCMWLYSYKKYISPRGEVPQTLFEKPFDMVRIFDLTADYIKAQIPLQN